MSMEVAILNGEPVVLVDGKDGVLVKHEADIRAGIEQLVARIEVQLPRLLTAVDGTTLAAERIRQLEVALVQAKRQKEFFEAVLAELVARKQQA